MQQKGEFVAGELSMIRTLVIASLTAAAVVAGAAFLATPSAPVKANTSAVNSHRHEIQRTTNECSQHAWRYYPGDCIRDYRHSSGKATEVRVVFATQLPNATTSSTK
jgi:hypothetical protein